MPAASCDLPDDALPAMPHAKMPFRRRVVCLDAPRSGGSASECTLFASSDALLVERGIWGLASRDFWRLLRAGELPERALLERVIGTASNCDDADIFT